MKHIPLYILDKMARREEQKIKELRQKLELPKFPTPEHSYEKEEDTSTPYKPLIIDMS
jgi:hypothetical protein